MSGIAERLKANPPRKGYRVGEIARFSGLSRQTVHNYTIMGLIREQEWTEGGHRLYDESVFAQLALIDELKSTRTLREVQAELSRQEQAVAGESPAFQGPARSQSREGPAQALARDVEPVR